MKNLRFLLLFVLIPFASRADEGMWLLPLLDELNMVTMNEMGLKLTAGDIYNLNHPSIKDAIVRFGGGCTGEVISDKGLVLTNHHCGYGWIQSHSTVEHNYLEDGFWAGSLEEELPNPGLTVAFLREIREVTGQVTKELTGEMSEGERQRSISAASRELEYSVGREGGDHMVARVSPIYGGNQFFLSVYEVYRDVRLVGTPPSSIGKFGYDTDNWMWPRHTGDFSLFRIYTAPDGSPAEYSPENVPLKPGYFLPLSLKGYEAGDFAMVLGYPGSTQRHITSWEIDELLDVTHPNRIKIRGARQEILWEAMLADEEIRIKYSSKYSGSSNYWKFSIGQSEGLTRLNIRQQKESLENEFLNWLAADPARNDRYGSALDLIRKAVTGRKELLNASQYISECLLRGSEIIYFTYGQYDLYEALQQEDEDLLPLALQGARNALESFIKDYHQPLDQEVTARMLRMFASDVPADHWPEELRELNRKYRSDWERITGMLFSQSVFGSPSSFRSFLDDPSLKELERDPLFLLAQSVRQKYTELREQLSGHDDEYYRGHRLYVAGLLDMKQEELRYPDANSTMRLTYGTVGGYRPRDAVRYSHYTTLKGIMEKEDPENYEFRVDERLKDLYRLKDYGSYAGDGLMHVCFTTNNDITGGNSGSPVLNGQGELTGLAFDVNWEATSGDIVFENQLQKCISVDIRYVLFIIDKYAGAHRIINELMIK